ncbi:hypothetical protein AB0J72_31550 [Dactylosporangium sp. NPDC049742]|uniref:effector-associated constant component EACC1 n=1 Tax=Dactylosporangium sp. NPDC049742 TaxID=3154737 RepID=UPI00343A017C
MDLQINIVEGPENGLEDLLAWLRDESALRGRIRPVLTPADSGRMGGALEAVLIAVAGGGVAALFNAIGLYLSRVREVTTLELTHRSGDAVKISGPGVTPADIDRAVEALRELDRRDGTDDQQPAGAAG